MPYLSHETGMLRGEPSKRILSRECLQKLPLPIAEAIQDFNVETHLYVKLHKLCDIAEIVTRFLSSIFLCDIFRLERTFPRKVQRVLCEKIYRPTFGAWKEILDTASIVLKSIEKEKSNQIFAPSLVAFVRGEWLRIIGSGGGNAQKHILAMRNQLSHSRAPKSTDELLSWLNCHAESLAIALNGLVESLSDYELISLDVALGNPKVVLLHGFSASEHELSVGIEPNIESLVPRHVYLYEKNKQIILDLFPLIVFSESYHWNEQQIGFEKICENSLHIYNRVNNKGLLEFDLFGTSTTFGNQGGSILESFQHLFPVDDWRAMQQVEADVEQHSLAIDSIVADLTDVFVGREDQVAALQKRIDTLDKGILWISGKPGIGKSALLAALTRKYRERKEFYSIIYFFRSGYFGGSIINFVNVACKQIQLTLNTSEEKFASFEYMKEMIKELVNKLKSTNKKILFFIDGIDELGNQVEELFPLMLSTLSEGVIWVCTSRDDELRRYIPDDCLHLAFHDGLPPLSDTAIRVMLLEHLGRLKYNLFLMDSESGQNQFVEAVARKSEGLPLYVQMVVEDLRSGRLTLYDESRLPESISGYFEESIKRLGVSDIGTILTPVLCLLSWAKEPLTNSTLAYLLNSHHLRNSPHWDYYFQLSLQVGRVMLKKHLNSKGELSWSLYHNALRQHLLISSSVRVNRDWAINRWIEISENWHELREECPELIDYLLRSYCQQLIDFIQFLSRERLYDKEKFVINRLNKLLSDIEFIGLRVQAGLIQQTILDYDRLLTFYTKSKDLENWHAFLRKECHVLSQFPDIFLQHCVNCGLLEGLQFDSSNTIGKESQNLRSYSHLLILRNKEFTNQELNAYSTIKTDTQIWTATAFSERYVLVGTNDGRILLWNVSASEPAKLVGMHSAAVWGIVTLGEHLVASCGDDNLVLVWDIAKGNRVHRLVGHTDWVRGISTLNDNVIASVGFDNTVRLWDILSGEEILKLDLDFRPTTIVQISNQDILLGDSRGFLHFFEYCTGNRPDLRIIASKQAHFGPVRAVRPLGDGRWVSCSDDGVVVIWNRHEIDRKIRVCSSAVRCIQVVPEKGIVTGGDDGTIRLLDIDSGREKATLHAHTGSVCSLTLLTEQILVSTGDDKRARVWDVGLLDDITLTQKRKHTDWVWCIAALGDYFVTTGDDGLMLVWDTNHGKCIERFEIGSHRFRVAKGFSKNKIAIGICSTRDSLDLTEGQNFHKGNFLEIIELCFQEKGVSRVDRLFINNESEVVSIDVLNNDDCIACAHEDGTINIWFVNSRNWKTISTKINRLSSIKFLDNELIAVASMDGRIAIIDLLSNSVIPIDLEDSLGVRALASIGKHTLISGSRDGSIRVWNLPARVCSRIIEGHEGSVRCISVLRDRYIISGSWDHTLKVWNIDTGKLMAVFSADGSVLCCDVVGEDLIAIGTARGTVYLLSFIPTCN